MIEQADRYPLTTGPDGRALLTLTLRRHARADADGYLRAQRYWACAPGGTQPRWLALGGDPRDAGDHAEDAREAARAHASAAAYLPGVSCSGCRDQPWKPVDRPAVTRYVRTGFTGRCVTCHDPAEVSPAADPPAVPRQAAPEAVATAVADLAPPQTVDARPVNAVTVRIDGPVAALLRRATGGDPERMSALVTDLICRNFGLGRPLI